MQQLMNQDTKTMSSMEIAELCEKRHDNVMADIRKVFEEAEIDALKFQGGYKDSNGQERPCYNLPRRECDLIVSGYSVKYRLAIIDRWQELEASNPALRSDLITHKRLAQKTWSDALKENREDQGKDTKAYHYSNENLMLNEVVLGERRPFAESEMADTDVQMLEDARVLNGSMIKLDIPYKERKIKLMQWRDKAGKKLMLGGLK